MGKESLSKISAGNWINTMFIDQNLKFILWPGNSPSGNLLNGYSHKKRNNKHANNFPLIGTCLYKIWYMHKID